MPLVPEPPEAIPTYDETVRAGRASASNFERRSSSDAPAAATARRAEHTFGDGSKEVKVLLKSHALSPGSKPLYYQNSIIDGSVVLNLSRGKSPQLVRVTVLCGVERLHQAYFKSRTDPTSFDIDRYEPFWKEVVEPFVAKDASGTKHVLGAGTHILPFQFRIPRKHTPHVNIAFNNTTQECDLPPSFVEWRNALSIQYIILVEVKFGFMKMNHDIPVLFRHVPITRPGAPPSPSIVGAYLLTSSIPTPAEEPEAFSEHSVLLLGSLFTKRFIVECKFFLIRPLAYTSGTRIPYFVHLSSPIDDENAAASTQAADLLHLSGSLILSFNRIVKMQGQVTQTYTDSLALGKTWLRKGVLEGRILQGEIDVPKGTQADFSFPSLEIWHHIQLSVKAPGIVINTIEPPPPPESHASRDKDPGPQAKNPAKLAIFIPVKLTNAMVAGVPDAPSYAPAPGYNDEP
ncbi:hypothetical protein DL93DRAFT_2191156 [Clavulina sp. PMI_390]|nr:hypothetical protein DL93DRAFT_2191156 [Clavulina sp. PMI_390]